MIPDGMPDLIMACLIGDGTEVVIPERVAGFPRIIRIKSKVEQG